MGYQIYVKDVLPDGQCDPLEVHKEEEYSGISGWDLESVPGVCAFGVDGHNALETAHKVRAWAGDVQKCLDWIRDKMAEKCTVTLNVDDILHATSADGTVTAAYRVKQLVEQCRDLKKWSSEGTWTPEKGCLDLKCEIEGLIMMADWLEKNAGKQFVHSY